MTDPRAADAGQAPRCEDPFHCITCSDEGIPMRVLWLDAEGTIARCEGASGVESEVLVGLIEELEIGEMILVHAGTALTRMPA